MVTSAKCTQNRLRVLVVSHPAILPVYREKFERLAAYQDLDLRVVTPCEWLEGGQQVRFEPLPHACCPVSPCPIRYSGYESRFFYTSGLREHFRDFRPQVIHLEEEPWSLCALQTWWMHRRFCPSAAVILRTSLSFWMRQRFGGLPRWIESRVLPMISYAFPLSVPAGATLERKGYTGPWEAMPNGVDVSRFVPEDATALREKLGLGDAFVVGYVGRLLWMKGVDLLLSACAQLSSNWRLLLVGCGEMQPELEQQAQKLGITERIRWTGAVPGEQVPDYLNCMDTLVLPSRTTTDWVEFFGRVLVEAMATRVPVIGASSGQIPEVIGDAGLVFTEDDAEALAFCLSQLMSQPELRQRLMEQGYERAHTRYSWELIAERTHAVYLALR